MSNPWERQKTSHDEKLKTQETVIDMNHAWSLEERQNERNLAIFKEVDTNINHEITTGFNAERNLPTTKKVKEGDLVEIYGKKYLILGFTHSSEEIEGVYRIKDVAHTKEVSEKEALEIAGRKEKLDEVSKFSNLFSDYFKLRDERYNAKADKKEELGKIITEIQNKIDASFLLRLEEIQGSILSPSEKRNLVGLFHSYNQQYLYKKDPYDYLKNKNRARAVELVSSLITDGADTMREEEKERLNEMDLKASRDKNLNSNEIWKLAYLKKKDERIEKLLMLKNWQELNYAPFDPQLEIRKIRHFREDEMASLSPNERLTIEKERLTNYKKNLLEQKNKIAEIQADIEKSIRLNPDVDAIELMDNIYLKASGAKMTEYQVEAFRKGIGEYIKKHQAVENNRKEHPDDKMLFTACFGRTPKGDVEIIKGPMTLYFRCHDLEDYTLIHEHKFNQSDKVTDIDKNRANLSAGVSIKSCNIDNLQDCIIAENSLGRPFRKDVYIHEEQHKIKKLFKDQMMRQNLMNAMEKSPIDERTKIVDDYLRAKRENFENRAKDEILAYFKDGTDLGELKKIMLKTKEQGGLYDYYGEWYNKEGVNERKNLIKEGANDFFVNSQFLKVFRNEYSRNIINPAIESMWYLKNHGWKTEKILLFDKKFSSAET